MAPGLGGVTVRLYSQNSSGNWVEAAGVSPTQTASNGAYTFQGIGTGTYQIQVFPRAPRSPGKDNVGTVGPIRTQGTVTGANQLQVPLTAGESGSQYNFGITGLQASYLSLRLSWPRPRR